MKSTIIYLVALVGFTNAATITLCADQSFGGTCTTFDANGCSELNKPHTFVSWLTRLLFSELPGQPERQG